MNGSDHQSDNDKQLRKVRIVNLTGHTLRLGTDVTGWSFKSQGRARSEPVIDVVERVRLMDGHVDTGINIPLITVSPGAVSGMTYGEAYSNQDTIYVTSGIVEQVLDEWNVMSPGRVHKEKGVVMYARALMRRVR